MNTKTFEIKDELKLTDDEKQSGDFVRLSDEQAEILRTMNRHQRKEWFSKEMQRIFKETP